MEPWADDRGQLTELHEDECWSLLESRPVGRLAWRGPHGVTVIPVNFVVVDEAIVVRTTPYSELARDCADLEVAFEVDDFDEHEHSGWSVLARGRCHHEVLASSSGPDAWPAGSRMLVLRIPVRSISGRRLSRRQGVRA